MGVTRSSAGSYDETCLAEDPRRELGASLANEVVAGLVIDVPDVLYDATLWRRWLVRLVTQLNPAIHYTSFFQAWDRQYLVDVHCGRREFAEAFQSFLLAAGLSWAQIDEIEAASRLRRHNFEQNVRPLPGVVKTMARLEALGLPIVAWADAAYSGARLAECLERLGLSNQFIGVLTSFDLELAQPSTGCYLAALESLDLPACQTVYVGHDAGHLAAAAALGMPTIAFNAQPGAKADFCLTRFEDLLPLVESRLPVAKPANEQPLASSSPWNRMSLVSPGGCR